MICLYLRMENIFANFGIRRKEEFVKELDGIIPLWGNNQVSI